MTEHLDWGKKRREKPPSDLPDSSIAKDFIELTIRKNLDPREEETQDELVLGRDGLALKLLERFRDLEGFIHGPEYKTAHIEVLHEPESELDRVFLQHNKSHALLFNNQFAGLNIQIASETFVDRDGAHDEVFAFSIVDVNGAEIVVYTQGPDVWAIVGEGDKKFKFMPSLSSKKYLAELADRLYRSPGTDDEDYILLE